MQIIKHKTYKKQMPFLMLAILVFSYMAIGCTPLPNVGKGGAQVDPKLPENDSSLGGPEGNKINIGEGASPWNTGEPENNYAPKTTDSGNTISPSSRELMMQNFQKLKEDKEILESRVKDLMLEIEDLKKMNNLISENHVLSNSDLEEQLKKNLQKEYGVKDEEYAQVCKNFELVEKASLNFINTQAELSVPRGYIPTLKTINSKNEYIRSFFDRVNSNEAYRTSYKAIRESMPKLMKVVVKQCSTYTKVKTDPFLLYKKLSELVSNMVNGVAPNFRVSSRSHKIKLVAPEVRVSYPYFWDSLAKLDCLETVYNYKKNGSWKGVIAYKDLSLKHACQRDCLEHIFESTCNNLFMRILEGEVVTMNRILKECSNNPPKPTSNEK